jgi:hypothetical protein
MRRYRWDMRRAYIKPEIRGTLIGVTAILIMLLSALGLQVDRHVARPRAAIDAYANWP